MRGGFVAVLTGVVLSATLAAVASNPVLAPPGELLAHGRVARIRLIAAGPPLGFGTGTVFLAETMESYCGPTGRFRFLSPVAGDASVGMDAQYLVVTNRMHPDLPQNDSLGSDRVLEFSYGEQQTLLPIVRVASPAGEITEWVEFSRVSMLVFDLPTMTMEGSSRILVRWSEMRKTLMERCESPERSG